VQSVSAVAHRGFSSVAPENTLAAFRKAIELCADMVECDVRRSGDGRLVVIHDPTVDRTTNGRGAVADMSLAELRELDAGSWFSAEFAGERIPTLEEVLDLPRGRSKLIVEVKEEGLEDEVVSAAEARGMDDEVLVASFHYRIGVRMPELDTRFPFIPLACLPRNADEDESVRVADEAASVNGWMFGVNHTAITPALVRATHAANLRLMAWTVNNEEDIRSVVEMGVDAIASNDLALLLRVLAEIGARENHRAEKPQFGT